MKDYLLNFVLPVLVSLALVATGAVVLAVASNSKCRCAYDPIATSEPLPEMQILNAKVGK